MVDPWQLTEREKRGAWTAAFAVASTFFGPFAPAAMWGFDFIYDRRDWIFGNGGVPANAITCDESLLSLSALGRADSRSVTPLTIVINLDNSAMNLGLKTGDPVSVIVTGHSYVQSRSGLVVPARVGSPVTVAVPPGSYSVEAFGSTKASLFAASDPYPAVGGDSAAVLGGSRQLAIPLTAREPLIRPLVRAQPGPGYVKVSPRTRRSPAPSSTTCAKCGRQVDPSTPMLAHVLLCQGRPRTHSRPNPGRARFAATAAITDPAATVSSTASPDLQRLLRSFRDSRPKVYRCPECNAIFYSQKALTDHRAAPYVCDRCLQRFTTVAALDSHFAVMHPLVKLWRDFW